MKRTELEQREDSGAGCRNTDTYGFGETHLFGGVRKYLSTQALRWLLEPQAGLIYKHIISAYSNSDACSSPYDDNEEQNTFGVGVQGYIGAEYFIADNWGIEGKSGIQAQYLDYDLEEKQKLKEYRLNTNSQVSVNFYW